MRNARSEFDFLVPCGRGLDRMALVNVLECIVGFAIGETLVRAVAVALGWGAAATGIAAAGVAVGVGYLFIVKLLFELSGRLDWAVWNALIADSRTLLAIAVADNAAMLALPAATGSSSWDSLLWGALAWVPAFLAALIATRWVLARGGGRAGVYRRLIGLPPGNVA